MDVNLSEGLLLPPKEKCQLHFEIVVLVRALNLTFETLNVRRVAEYIELIYHDRVRAWLTKCPIIMRLFLFRSHAECFYGSPLKYCCTLVVSVYCSDGDP